jgi:type II secretion system protein N
VKEQLLKYAKYAGPVGYPVFYVFCLAIFTIVTFPYEKLREHLVVSFNGAEKAAGSLQELTIEDMSGYWLSGIKMTGVSLASGSNEPGKPLTKISIEQASARYSLLPLLIGNSDMNFDAYAFGGEASGSYDVSGKDREVDVTLDSIDIGNVQPLVDLLGVPLGGKLGGTVDLKLPEGKASKGSGSISLEVGDVWVGDGKAKVKNTLALPKMTMGNLTFAADAKDGVLRISKFVAGGKDVDVQGDGKITMRELATDSLLDLQIRFRINDAYRSKSDLTKTLFGAPGSTAPSLFEMADPQIKASKRPDGFFAWAFNGPLGHPRVSPAAAGAVAPAGLGFPAPKPASPTP